MKYIIRTCSLSIYYNGQYARHPQTINPWHYCEQAPKTCSIWSHLENITDSAAEATWKKMRPKKD